MSLASAGTSASRATCPLSAASVFADTTHGIDAERTLSPGTLEIGETPGASTIRCELVPETPNEEMPARRGRSDSGHGVAEVSRETEPADQSTWEDGEVMCRVRGRTPCRIA